MKLSVSRAVPMSLLLVLAGLLEADGTLVFDEKATCPICKNIVNLTRLGSWGSYIYEDQSKYDLIYAPRNYKSFIATCSNCGYSQTVQDFLSPTPSQVQKLKETKLMTDWKVVASDIPFADRLQRALQINETLGRKKDFWAVFNRILIYHYRDLDPERAKDIARLEIALLKYDPDLLQKQYLYLQGEYSRLTGDHVSAKRFFTKAAATSINSELTRVVVMINGGSVLIGGLLVILFKRRLAAFIALGFAITVLIVTMTLHSRVKQPPENDQYYDEIISHRAQLLEGVSKQ